MIFVRINLNGIKANRDHEVCGGADANTLSLQCVDKRVI